MSYPINMDSTTYLGLPGADKKRLSALRSRLRTQARKEGQPLPPTIAVELGLAKEKAPKPETAKVCARVGDDENPVSEKDARAARRARALERRDSWTPSGPVPMSPRTICDGMFYWTPGNDRSEYEAAAREKGYTNQLPLYNGEKESGILYFESMSDADVKRLRAIFSVTKSYKVRFGEKESLN